MTLHVHRCPRCRALLSLLDAVRRPDGSLIAVCDACTAVFPVAAR